MTSTSMINRQRLGALFLLAVEFFLLESHFRISQLESVKGAFVEHLLLRSSWIINFFLALGFLSLVMIWPRLSNHADALRTSRDEKPFFYRCLIQLLTLVPVFFLTDQILNHYSEVSHLLWALAPFWAISILLFFASSLCCLAPPSFWYDFLKLESRLLATAALISLLVVVAAIGIQGFWKTHLVGVTFSSVIWILGQFVDPSMVHVNEAKRIIEINRFWVNIEPACSGYEGVILVLAFLGAYAFVFRKELKFPATFLIFPIGVAFIWAMNIVRIAALILIGVYWSADVALQGFHSHAGWLVFNVLALSMVWVLRTSPLFAKTTASQRRADLEVSKTVAGRQAQAMLWPLIVFFAATLLLGVLSAGFDWFYPLKMLAILITLWLVRKHLNLQFDLKNWHVTTLASATVFLLWILFVPDVSEADNQAFQAHLQSVPHWQASLWLVFRLAGTILIIPLIEEIAFRSYLLCKLSGVSPSLTGNIPYKPLAIAISSLAFGLLHSAWIAGTLAGVCYSFVRFKTSKVSDAVAAHALTNAMVVIYVLASGKWHLL